MKKFNSPLILIVLASLILGASLMYVYEQKLVKKNVVQSVPSAVNNQTNIKTNIQSFPWLNLPLEYFANKDVQWGSGESGHKITDYTEVGLNNKAVYQSYPTTDTTIKNYSSTIKPLKTKSFNEVMQELAKTEPDGSRNTMAKDNYQKYGSLATNYLPTKYIWNLDKFDVDGDGVPETVVGLNYAYADDAGSYNSDIIKGNNIIFSVQEDNASIVPADTTNGFYVEWRNPNDQSARCCQEGFIRTRFVFKDGKFVPIYEQEVKYLKVGKE